MNATSYKLRPDQQRATDNALEFLSSKERRPNPSRLYSSPTGSGKSYILAEVKRQRGPTHYQVVPSLEIAASIALKLDPSPPQIVELTESALRRWTESLQIYTAGRLRNKLLGGSVRLPTTVAFDEAHHTISRTNEDIWTLMGRPPRIGTTATVYRGTPEGTHELLESWNHDVFTVVSLSEAIAAGLISMPDFNVWPLMNDDIISVVNGEFHVKQVDALAKDKMGDLIERVRAFYNGSVWDRATMLSFSSIEQVSYALAAFTAAGLPALAVVGATKDRESVFRAVTDRSHVLLQIKVVGEGVDLPLRRLIDLAPTMSPVAWMQRVGRITRPKGPDEPAPEYIACCHNLTRHAYLWYGLIPPAAIKRAQTAWGEEYKPVRRSMARVLGLEGFGRFAPTPIPLADGLTGSFYGLQSKMGEDQWGIFMHPVTPAPLYFHRRNAISEVQKDRYGNRMKIYAKWRRIQSIPDVQGAVSLATNPLTPGQKRKWKNEAKDWGLDPEATVNAKQFQLLPALRDSGVRIKEIA